MRKNQADDGRPIAKARRAVLYPMLAGANLLTDLENHSPQRFTDMRLCTHRGPRTAVSNDTPSGGAIIDAPINDPGARARVCLRPTCSGSARERRAAVSR